MGLSRTLYNNIAKTLEQRKGPKYQGPKKDIDLQYKGSEMEKDLKYYGPVESKISKQDIRQNTR